LNVFDSSRPVELREGARASDLGAFNALGRFDGPPR
jgi:hypothetical protein